MFNAAYATGCVSGPVIGGAIKDSISQSEGTGFRETCDIMAIASLVVSILYFLLSILPPLIRGGYPKREIQFKWANF